MAPAACDTINAHLKNLNRTVDDYDFIATGDLGKLGSEILIDLMEREGVILKQKHLQQAFYKSCPAHGAGIYIMLRRKVYYVLSDRS